MWWWCGARWLVDRPQYIIVLCLVSVLISDNYRGGYQTRTQIYFTRPPAGLDGLAANHTVQDNQKPTKSGLLACSVICLKIGLSCYQYKRMNSVYISDGRLGCNYTLTLTPSIKHTSNGDQSCH